VVAIPIASHSGEWEAASAMGAWLSRAKVDAFVPETPGQVKNTSHEADHSGLRTRVLLNGA
jgi:hypothetical protein